MVMGNNTPWRIANIERVKINMSNEIVRTLDVIRLVPNLKRKISLSTLDLKRYKDIGESWILNISKDAYIVTKGQKMSQLYVLHGSTEFLKINQQNLGT